MKYIATHANGYGRLNLKPHIRHIAGTGNHTLCGRVLSDPWSVSATAGHDLCNRCQRAYANQGGRACSCMVEPDENGIERVVTHSSTCRYVSWLYS